MDVASQPILLDRAAVFGLFADLFDYPSVAGASALHRAAATMTPASSELRKLVNDFIARVRAMTPSQLEELYAGTFDLQPDCTLNLGHHLFAEDHGKRSALLIELAAEARAAGLTLGGELPDHLCWLLRLLAVAADDSDLHDLIPCCILPALRSLSERISAECPYQPLLHALLLLLTEPPMLRESAS